MSGSPDFLAHNQANRGVKLNPKRTSSPMTRLSISCRATEAAGGLLLSWELRAGRAAAVVASSREARSWATVSFSLRQGREGKGN